jgi:hypothetical protein
MTPLPGLTGDGVGDQPGPVGDVDDLDLLALDDVGGGHELRVDREGTHVVQVRLGHGGAVDLSVHQDATHGLPLPGELVRLG